MSEIRFNRKSLRFTGKFSFLLKLIFWPRVEFNWIGGIWTFVSDTMFFQAGLFLAILYILADSRCCVSNLWNIASCSARCWSSNINRYLGSLNSFPEYLPALWQLITIPADMNLDPCCGWPDWEWRTSELVTSCWARAKPLSMLYTIYRSSKPLCCALKYVPTLWDMNEKGERKMEISY